MASEATTRELSDLAKITSGKRPPSAFKTASISAKIPVVGGGGISGFTERPLFSKTVLITGRVGTLGKLFRIDGPVWPSDNALVVIADEDEIDPNFLQYALQAVIHHAVGMNRGAANPLVTQTDLGRLPISVLPRSEQEKVAYLLRLIDDRIDLLHQTNTTLEAIAQALFKSWFVDFDPVRAKAEGREPEGMDSAIAALFPSELEESRTGSIPKGWRTGTLADMSRLNASKWTARKHPPTVKYIDLSGVYCNRIDQPMEFSFDEAPSRARQQLREGDTIIGTVRPGNRAFAYIHGPDTNLTGSTGFAVLSPNAPNQSSYIYLAATRNDAIDRLANLADGGAYPAVRPSVVADTPCVIPHDSVLTAFAGSTTPLLEKIARNRYLACTLADLRDTLLPHLISGTLHLPDTQELLEEVAS